ncbi:MULTISPECIES: hypothetical protein [Nostocales]|uniref:Uncharacterized protein n=3 Tax=Nostocales TaxID=1161 RepID=A0A0C1N6X7_9CYAN|nr:hypothetical protein [Tolypothrix bouteillei]KAF3885793.1 hypothetical protein DA73_0400010175 [Tolypothrix bouteillei VB521301]
MSQILLYIGITIALIFGFPILLTGLITGVIFFATRQLPKVANTFFHLIALGKIKEAYQSTALEFQDNTSQADLVDFLQANFLMNYKRAFWLSRFYKNYQSWIGGNIITQSGTKIPIKVHFIKENGFWKIYALEKSQNGIVKDSRENLILSGLIEDGTRIKPVIPTEMQAKQLAYDTLMSFYETVETNNFIQFYDSISFLWQQQTSIVELESAFKDFLGKRFSLSGIVAGRIHFLQPPDINENNWLQLRGQVPDVIGYPSMLDFDLQYVREEAIWKLVKIKINVEKFKTEVVHNGKRPKYPLQIIDITDELKTDFWADRN